MGLMYVVFSRRLVRLKEATLPQSRGVEVVGYSEGNHGSLMSLNPESLLLYLVSFITSRLACNATSK